MNPLEGEPVSADKEQPSKSWREPSSEDQARLVLALGSLTEFAAGFNITTSFTQYTSNPQNPPIRFLYQSLHQYLHASYMDQPANGLVPVLETLGMSAHIKELNNS